MSQPPSPPETTPARPRGVARRAFLIGGVAGATAGAAAGAGVTKSVGWGEPERPPAPPAPDPVIVERPLPDSAKLSFSQQGEDLIAASLFDAIGVPKPTYLDIGAWEPIASNNTYLFYALRGSRGVLVEPTPRYAEKLKAARPGDTTLGVGIGITDATDMDFYVMSEPQQNTFDKAYAEKFVRERGYKIERVIKIPLLNINRVMAEHFGGVAPDYLSIDVEGLEFAIAKTIDFARFRPKLICIETLVPTTLVHDPEITAYMVSKGYELRGMTYPNSLYIDRGLLTPKKK